LSGISGVAKMKSKIEFLHVKKSKYQK